MQLHLHQPLAATTEVDQQQWMLTTCGGKEATKLAKFESHERAFHDRGLPYVYGGVHAQCAMRACSWRATRVRYAYGARTVRVRRAYGVRSVCAARVRRACGVRAVRARRAMPHPGGARAMRARCLRGACKRSARVAGAQCGPLRSSAPRLCGESVCVPRCFVFPNLICLSKYDVVFEVGCAFSRAAAHATTCV